MRPIDADELIKRAHTQYDIDIDDINDMPTLDVAPIIHAKWEEDVIIDSCCVPETGYRCTNCQSWRKMSSIHPYAYCPNCGADMRVVNNEN